MLSHTAPGVHLRRHGANQQPIKANPMSIGGPYVSFNEYVARVGQRTQWENYKELSTQHKQLNVVKIAQLQAMFERHG